MSNGFASALEISAKIIRQNGKDHTTARRLIAERVQSMGHADNQEPHENTYLLNMEHGFRAALAGLYEISQRGER
jgi:hypothetical protein